MATQSKQSSLLPVYLIAGEDELKRETVMKRLFARLSKMGDMSFNSETFSGLTCTGEEVITAANTLPFASEVRLVLVNDVDKLKSMRFSGMAAVVRVYAILKRLLPMMSEVSA